jgi:hypothetical protein
MYAEKACNIPKFKLFMEAAGSLHKNEDLDTGLQRKKVQPEKYITF